MKICSRHVGKVEESPDIPIIKGSDSAMIESDRDSEVRTRLSQEDRQFIVQKLSEMLVLDYQANQAVTRPTVEKPSLLNRKAGVASHSRL